MLYSVYCTPKLLSIFTSRKIVSFNGHMSEHFSNDYEYYNVLFFKVLLILWNYAKLFYFLVVDRKIVWPMHRYVLYYSLLGKSKLSLLYQTCLLITFFHSIISTLWVWRFEMLARVYFFYNQTMCTY